MHLTSPDSIALAHKLRNKLHDAVEQLLEARDLANKLANAEVASCRDPAGLQYENVVHVWTMAEIAMRNVELYFLPPKEARQYRELTASKPPAKRRASR